MKVRFALATALVAGGLLAQSGLAHAQYQRPMYRGQAQGYYVPEQQYQNQGYSGQEQGYGNQPQGYTSQYYQGGSQQGQGVLTDRMIANWLGALSKMEIELAQCVQGKSSFNSINKYARHEIQNHRELLRDLTRFTPNPGAGIGEDEQEDQSLSQSSGRSRDFEGSRRGGAQQATYQESDNQSQSQMQQTVSFPRLRREICNEVLRSLEHELQTQHGMDFDWAFVGQQCVLHDQMIAEMKVLRRYASPQLREVIEDALDEARQDERQLAQLMDQLKDQEKSDHGSRASRDNSSGSRQSSRDRNEG